MRPSLILVRLFCLLFIQLACFISARATHLRAGEITVELIDCASRTFRITITVYTNTGSTVLFGGRAGEEDLLDFGDGSPQVLVPETPNTLRPDLGPNIGTASFSTIHSFPGGAPYYIISYREPNRNEGVLNMDQSVNTRFYLETKLVIDPFLKCDSSPILLIAPIDQACTGVAFFHNPGAYDPDPQDSLSYEMVVPYSDNNVQVINYRDPNAQGFYNNYNTGNEDADGPPTFSIDPITGTLIWDSPGAAGEYNIAFVVRSWRKIPGTNIWRDMGFVRRDMQIVVLDCDNDRPDLIIPNDTCIVAGTTLEGVIQGIDPNGDDVKIEAFSSILEFPNSLSPATYTPPPAFRPQPSILNFEWNTICQHVKQQPYQVVFKVTDKPTSGPSLTTSRTWAITVVGPPPIWQDAILNGTTSSLEWEDYSCRTQADSMEIWRRVGSLPYDPGVCETGISEFLGYQLIKTVPIGQTTFDDSGLAPGAVYCYRLVATFPEGSKSIMSEEICVGPVLSEAPVITHVTIDKTSDTEGEITIRWEEPTDGVGPFEYEVYRGDGFAGTPSVAVIPGRTSDLFVTDNFLDTRNNVYHYFVVSYDVGDNKDTSAVASSVRLELKSQLQKIELSWAAFVPWSNYYASSPLHDIYRGPAGSTEADLQFLGTANVFAAGFTFVDEGPLNDDQEYCYRIMTRGGYGNPALSEPFENYSQIICATPSDTLPPCEVQNLVAINAPDCTDSLTVGTCNQNVFENRIEWEPPNGDCGNDVAYYHVYVSNVMGGEFTLHPNDKNNIRETFFVDNNLTSYARCYRVSAVDRSGNEGPLSDPLCIDNCPYYELPNALTPNNDGCNDLFSAFSSREGNVGENGADDGICAFIPDEIKARCARFVDAVNFKVFNRWGKEVYTYKSGGERTIYIDWNGKDNDGGELSTGVYYYVAEVTFITIDPSKRRKKLKGWIHLVR